MNEIEKLKTEHARYREALEEIISDYADQPTSLAALGARNALNPPPPAPVTLDELKTALAAYNKANPNGGLYSIAVYRDESGSIRDGGENRVFSFATLREAVNFLMQ